MTAILEIHIDMEEVDGKLVFAKAKGKFKGLIIWREIGLYELKKLLENI